MDQGRGHGGLRRSIYLHQRWSKLPLRLHSPRRLGPYNICLFHLFDIGLSIRTPVDQRTTSDLLRRFPGPLWTRRMRWQYYPRPRLALQICKAISTPLGINDVRSASQPPLFTCRRENPAWSMLCCHIRSLSIASRGGCVKILDNESLKAEFEVLASQSRAWFGR